MCRNVVSCHVCVQRTAIKELEWNTKQTTANVRQYVNLHVAEECNKTWCVGVVFMGRGREGERGRGREEGTGEKRKREERQGVCECSCMSVCM